jgi:hypothetical protein
MAVQLQVVWVFLAVIGLELFSRYNLQPNAKEAIKQRHKHPSNVMPKRS